MMVRAVAHVRNEDVRRILNKAECEPGDLFDLPDGLAEVYLLEGWVVKTGDQRMVTNAIETAMMPGAPEMAARRKPRGRRSQQGTI